VWKVWIKIEKQRSDQQQSNFIWIVTYLSEYFDFDSILYRKAVIQTRMVLLFFSLEI
jgi:hypothetical protein